MNNLRRRKLIFTQAGEGESLLSNSLIWNKLISLCVFIDVEILQ